MSDPSPVLVQFSPTPPEMNDFSAAVCESNAARSHRCAAAAQAGTESLSNHFALLPRSHRGPVSLLARYPALFICTTDSYLLSPGPRIRCFSILFPNSEDQISCNPPRPPAPDVTERRYVIHLQKCTEYSASQSSQSTGLLHRHLKKKKVF